MIGAAEGYKVKLCLPANASHERKRILQGVRRGDRLHRSGRRLRRRDPQVPRDLRRATRTATSIPDQYNNPANWQAHYETTRSGDHASRPSGRLTHFVAGHGHQRHVHGRDAAAARGCCRTCGAISAQPSIGFHGLEGLKHMPTAIVPGIYDDVARRTGTSGSRPRTRTRWCGALAREEGCWWASRRARTWLRPCKSRSEIAARGEQA